MFETSVVRVHTVNAAAASRLLTLSLVAHAALITGALVMSVADIDFPRAAPDQFALAPSLTPIVVPPPLGTPEGGRRAAAPAERHPAPVRSTITAPPVVPDVVPEVTTAGDGAGTSEGTSESGSEGPLGQPYGVEDSIGELDAQPALPVREEPRIYEVGGEVKAPVALHRAQPPYPRSLIHTRMSATVVVRCIIGKDGSIREPVILHGSLPPFNEAVLAAVRDWRFRPGTFRGQPVETWFELRVNFAAR
jgi:protein TonB